MTFYFVQLREAVRYSFFLDSYGNSANVDDTSTDTGDVCAYAV